MAKVKLSDIVNGMDSMGDETRVFFDRQSGEVIMLMDYELRRAENEDDDEDEDKIDEADPPEWQRETLEQAKAVACDDGTRFLSLPDKFEINEWEMMQSFAQAQEDERLAEALLNAIRGRGAFRCFKDRVYEADIADEWYRFRDDAYRRIALEWCEWNKIDVDNDVQRRPSG